MATKTDRKWNKKMTIAEMLPLMSDAEIAKNARRGGIAAIEEQKRRRAPAAPVARTAAPVERIIFQQPTTLHTRADILAERRYGSWADRILPDPELDIGV